MLVPTEAQEAAIQQMVFSPTKAALNGSVLGEGKTIMTVEVILRLKAEVVLIICPLGTRIGWERTLKGQGWTHPIHRIDSTVGGKAAFWLLKDDQPGVYLVGREYFRRLDWSKVHPDIAISDECHGWSNRKSVGFKKIKTLHADYKMALSGTFFGNKFENSWAVARWLWPKEIDNSFWRWSAEWAVVEDDFFAGKKVCGERVPGSFVKSLPCYIRLESTMKTEVIEESRVVDLYPAQRKMYDDIQRDMLTWLGENPLVVELPITMRVRLRQATLGTLSFGLDDEIIFDNECKSSKIDALKELLVDLEDEPVLILTDSKRFAKVVAYRLGDKAAQWTGDTPQADREALLNTFGRDGGPQYIVATIAALGPGIDGLQHTCSTVVWLSRSENNNDNQQVLGRLHRTGQGRDVRSIDILAENTYDEGILGNLLQIELNNRASMRRTNEQSSVGE